jgi:hypothetical protein
LHLAILYQRTSYTEVNHTAAGLAKERFFLFLSKGFFFFRLGSLGKFAFESRDLVLNLRRRKMLEAHTKHIRNSGLEVPRGNKKRKKRKK